MRNYRYLAPLSLLWGLVACDSLETRPHDQCGNTVIEVGEDCDGAGIGDNACNASCRLDCTAEGACPAGWGCGSDRLCRQPSGEFEAFGSALALSADRLALADFDGDGRSDLLATRGSSLSIAYSDVRSLLPQANVIAFTPIDAIADIPSAGDLDGDGRADLALRLGRGLGVLRGEQDRTLLPTQFSRALPVDVPAGAVLFAANVDPRSEAPGDELLALTDTSLVLVYSANLGDLPTKPLYTWPGGHPPIAGEVVRGNLVLAAPGATMPSPQDEVVFAFQGGSTLEIFEPLLVDAEGTGTWNYDGAVVPPATIAMPGTATIKDRVFAGHANWQGDNGVLDLLVAGTEGGEDHLHVSFNTGYRAFTSVPFYNSPATTDGLATRFTPRGADPGLAEPVLAVGFLNLDTLPDLVTPHGIFMSACDPFTQCQLVPDALAPADGLVAPYVKIAGPDSDAGWTSAVHVTQGITQYDAYLGDILTTSAEPGFTLYKNVAGGFLNPFQIPTQSAVADVTVGDFDGDGVRDFLFSQLSKRTTGEDPALESLHISFGDPLGLPTPAADLGDVGQVEHITAARLVQKGVDLDSISDFVVRAKTGDLESGYVFTGSTDKQVQSPLDLPAACTGASVPAGVPRYSAIAQLDGDGGKELAVLYRQKAAGALSYALWAVHPESNVSADVCATLVGPGELPDPGAGSISMLPVDLDGNGKDEILIFAAGSSSLFVAQLGEGGTWSVATVALGGPHLGLTTGALRSPAAGSVPVVDVLLWSEDGVTVLHNDGKGKLDPAKATKIAIAGLPCPVRNGGAAPGSPTGVAVLNVDDDGEREIVVLTPSDTFLVDLAGEVAGSFAAPVCKSDVFGGGGEAITQGDVDGDGVDDLVLARPGGIQVLTGVAVVQ